MYFQPNEKIIFFINIFLNIYVLKIKEILEY